MIEDCDTKIRYTTMENGVTEALKIFTPVSIIDSLPPLQQV